MEKPTILVCAGPRATITNSPPLVTSNKGRNETTETDPRFEHLVPQLLHEPVTVKIKKFSAHPLEEDKEQVYHNNNDEYYEVTLRPDDGLYPLPYVARRADGSVDGTPFEPDDHSNPGLRGDERQFFYPDASRIFEEIDRGVHGRAKDGTVNCLGKKAEYEFIRLLPSGGYTNQGEKAGEDYFPYEPRERACHPRLGDLAKVTNQIQNRLDDGDFAGVLWLEGSPQLEETLYWLQLLVDTEIPLVGTVANRPHGMLSNDGDRNIVDAVEYIVSGSGESVGAVAIQDQVVYAAREFKKKDARPGAFTAVGGQGGVIGTVKADVTVRFTPNYAHTSTSNVNLRTLPDKVSFYDRCDDPSETTIRIKQDGQLIGTEIPRVSILKGTSYPQVEGSIDPGAEVDILARVEQALAEQESEAERKPNLHGIIFEGNSPYGSSSPSQDRALEIAAFSGVPVVRVGRCDPGGPVQPHPEKPSIGGSNLDANKAVMLLTAALLKLGRLPKAADPVEPATDERKMLMEKIAAYQEIFDGH